MEREALNGGGGFAVLLPVNVGFTGKTLISLVISIPIAGTAQPKEWAGAELYF